MHKDTAGKMIEAVIDSVSNSLYKLTRAYVKPMVGHEPKEFKKAWEDIVNQYHQAIKEKLAEKE